MKGHGHHDLVIEFASDHLLLVSHQLVPAGNSKTDLNVISSKPLHVLDGSRGNGKQIQLEVGPYQRTREFGMKIYKEFV
jgi:hypothetical protein